MQRYWIDKCLSTRVNNSWDGWLRSRIHLNDIIDQANVMLDVVQMFQMTNFCQVTEFLWTFFQLFRFFKFRKTENFKKLSNFVSSRRLSFIAARSICLKNSSKFSLIIHAEDSQRCSQAIFTSCVNLLSRIEIRIVQVVCMPFNEVPMKHLNESLAVVRGKHFSKADNCVVKIISQDNKWWPIILRLDPIFLPLTMSW